MTIVFDFDGTLFDTEACRAILEAQAFSGTFFEHEDLSPYIFADVVPFFQSIPHVRKALMTAGDPTFQRAKVERAKAMQLFDTHFFVGDEMKGDVLAREFPARVGKGEKIYLVEDRAGEIEYTRKVAPHVTVIRAVRHGNPHALVPTSMEIPEIATLFDLVRYIGV